MNLIIFPAIYKQIILKFKHFTKGNLPYDYTKINESNKYIDLYMPKIRSWRQQEFSVIKKYGKNYKTRQLNNNDFEIIKKVNWKVNKEIKYTSDEKDLWSPSYETAHKGAGDCEDQAILKLIILRQFNIPDDNLGIVIINGHAFTCVYKNINDNDFYMLDNGNCTYFVQKASRVLPYLNEKLLCGFNLFDRWIYKLT